MAVVVRSPQPTLRQTLLEAATLPARIATAATQTTLALGTLAAPDGPIRRRGGYADLVLQVIGERGHVAQLMELLREDGGPMRLVETLTDLTAADRPVGKVLQRDGMLDRLMAEDGVLSRLTSTDGNLDRLLGTGGPVDRLLAADGPLERLLSPGGALDRLVADEGVLDRLLCEGGALDRLTSPGGLLDRLLAPGGLGDRLLSDEGYLDKLIAEGGTLDQLVHLGTTLDELRPRLEQIAGLIPDLSDSAESLHRAVGPLSDLVSRLPGARRRTSTGDA